MTRLRAAQTLLDGGEAQAAVPELEMLCADFPQWPAAWINLAIARLRTGRIHESQDALDVAEALDPGSFACEVAFAEFHARLGFFDRAVTRLDRALALTPPSTRAQTTAIELRRFCQEHAKTLYYRQAAYPRLPFRWRGADRTAPQSTSVIERNN
jgi:predicted Zn-dependent protease